MQVVLEVKEGLERALKVSIPAEEIEAQIDIKIKELAKKANVKGFRPGKVPLKVVTERYGEAVRNEVAGETIQKTLFEAIKQENLELAGSPAIEEAKVEAGQPLEYTAKIEVVPEIALTPLDKLTPEVMTCDITDADLDKALEQLREQHKEWSAVERAAADSDQVTIDFEGTMDGEPLEGGAANDHQLVIGSDSFIKGFEEGIAGHQVGDEFELSLNFPEEYHHKEIAGKPVVFKVTLKKVEESTLPELNDAFAEKFDIKEGGLAKLKEEIKSNLEKETAKRLRNINKNSVLTALVAANDIPLPNVMVEEQAEHMSRQMQQMAAQYMKQESPAMDAKLFIPEAKKSVKRNLALKAIIKQEKLEAPSAKIRERIEEMAAQYHDPQQLINAIYGSDEHLRSVEFEVLEEMAVDFVTDKAKSTNKALTYQELVDYKEETAQEEEAAEDVE
jgi:trigger factor